MMADNKMTDSKGTAQNGNRQDAGTDREGGFVHSPAEANVFPAGSAQRSHGGAGGEAPGGAQGGAGDQAPSAAGTPDEARLGGSGGTSASGTTGNDPDR
jgi:hypothetical protein